MNIQITILGPVLGVLASTGVAGEVPLRDPTRPPQAPVIAPGQASAPAPVSLGALTAIRIGDSLRSATIGGKRVKVGERIGESTVRAIRPSEVVLATPSGAQVLKLFPGVHQQASAARNNSLAAARDAHPSTRSGTAVAHDVTIVPAQGESSR